MDSSPLSAPAAFERPGFRVSHSLPILPCEDVQEADLSSVRTSATLVSGVEEKKDGRVIWWRLLLITFYLILGLCIGAYQHWSILFSLYFTVETLTTVGYGDFSLDECSEGCKFLVGVFAVLGLFVMGSALTVIFEQVYELERTRIDRLLKNKSEHATSHQQHEFPEGWMRRRDPKARLKQLDEVFVRARCRLRWNLLLCLTSFVATISVGAFLVGSLEGWSVCTSIYWACVTFSSVGYGDLVPTQRASRTAAIGLMAIGVVVVGSSAGFIGGYTSFVRDLKQRREVLTQFGTELTPDAFETLARGEEIESLGLSSSPMHITKAEFCLYMLVKLGRVSEDELRASQAAFDVLDVTGGGVLDHGDVRVNELRRIHRLSRATAPEGAV